MRKKSASKVQIFFVSVRKNACIVCVLEMDKMCMNYAKTRFFDRHLSRSLVRTSSPLYRGD